MCMFPHIFYVPEHGKGGGYVVSREIGLFYRSLSTHIHLFSHSLHAWGWPVRGRGRLMRCTTRGGGPGASSPFIVTLHSTPFPTPWGSDWRDQSRGGHYWGGGGTCHGGGVCCLWCVRPLRKGLLLLRGGVFARGWERRGSARRLCEGLCGSVLALGWGCRDFSRWGAEADGQGGGGCAAKECCYCSIV